MRSCLVHVCGSQGSEPQGSAGIWCSSEASLSPCVPWCLQYRRQEGGRRGGEALGPVGFRAMRVFHFTLRETEDVKDIWVRSDVSAQVLWLFFWEKTSRDSDRSKEPRLTLLRRYCNLEGVAESQEQEKGWNPIQCNCQDLLTSWSKRLQTIELRSQWHQI